LWKGLTLEASRGATILGRGAAAVLVDDTPDVTIRGFRLQCPANQHALLVEGATTGLTVEGVSFVQEAGRRPHSAVVRISASAQGAPGAAVRIRECRVVNQGLGVCVLDPMDKTRLLGGVRLESNEFSGPGVHVLLQGAVSHVDVTGNRFLGGINGVNLN